jgi:L-ascorbate metabolism protein UlaG (beta-lactamase superfamily)
MEPATLIGRRAVLRGLVALGGGLTLGAARVLAQPAPAAAPAAPLTRLTGGRLSVRWLGGGVVELATPDYKQMAYLDAWVWNNAGWTRFNVPKPPEYATKAGFVQYVAGKKPEAVFVLLTHDHLDHMGDYLELLAALNAAGLPVMTVGQSDLMRKGLVDDFKAAGLDPAKIVVNGGAGINFGGTARHGAMTARLVPAIHSTLHGFPAAGFVLEIGGLRAYLSGDTDLYGDLRLVGERYQPNLAIVCVGDGPFTMGPLDAARACQMLGVSHAIPVHFAHNPLVLGATAGEDFQRALASVAPGITALVMKPGDTRLVQI